MPNHGLRITATFRILEHGSAVTIHKSYVDGENNPDVRFIFTHPEKFETPDEMAEVGQAARCLSDHPDVITCIVRCGLTVTKL